MRNWAALLGLVLAGCASTQHDGVIVRAPKRDLLPETGKSEERGPAQPEVIGGKGKGLEQREDRSATLEPTLRPVVFPRPPRPMPPPR
jgi:hypothetical protein